MRPFFILIKDFFKLKLEIILLYTDLSSVKFLDTLLNSI